MISERDFKFKIGDHVLPSMVAESLCKSIELIGEVRVPEAYRIGMRCLEECVGGVQLAYKLFTWEGKLTGPIPEEAIVSMDDVYTKWFNEYLIYKKEVHNGDK